jgi:hypothetical protein
MYSATTRGRLALLVGCIALAGAGGFFWWHHAAPRRAEYLLINETGQHDYDLAFKMSLKLAEKKSGIENALVLLASLPPSKTIEQVATELFTRLHIGTRRNGRGILYVYSATENLMKIEVSYALEGDLPDVYCHYLEEAAKTYMLSEVPQDFISELIITTNLRAIGTVGEAKPLARPTWLNQDFLSGGGGALVRGYGRTLADYEDAIRRLPEADLKAYLPTQDLDITVQRYLASLAEGVGDPRLPFLTEGSRLFRALVPRDEAQQQRIGEFFRAAAPYRLIVKGNLALVVPQAGHSNLPLVLRRATDKLWYVDEAKSWSYFHRFEDNVNFFVKYSDNPFLGDLRALDVPNMDRAIYADHVGTPDLREYPYSLGAALRTLQDRIRDTPSDAAAYAALGDLYLFEANWLTKAVTSYEKAAAIAPENLQYHWRLADLYLNTSRVENMLAELKFLSEHLPADRPTQEWYRYYKQEYDFPRD